MEFRIANAIVRQRLVEEGRLIVTGRLQYEKGDIHIMAEEITGMPDLGLPLQASHDYH